MEGYTQQRVQVGKETMRFRAIGIAQPAPNDIEGRRPRGKYGIMSHAVTTLE